MNELATPKSVNQTDTLIPPGDCNNTAESTREQVMVSTSTPALTLKLDYCGHTSPPAQSRAYQSRNLPAWMTIQQRRG